MSHGGAGRRRSQAGIRLERASSGLCSAPTASAGHRKAQIGPQAPSPPSGRDPVPSGPACSSTEPLNETGAGLVGQRTHPGRPPSLASSSGSANQLASQGTAALRRNEVCQTSERRPTASPRRDHRPRRTRVCRQRRASSWARIVNVCVSSIWLAWGLRTAGQPRRRSIKIIDDG